MGSVFPVALAAKKRGSAGAEGAEAIEAMEAAAEEAAPQDIEDILLQDENLVKLAEHAANSGGDVSEEHFREWLGERNIDPEALKSSRNIPRIKKLVGQYLSDQLDAAVLSALEKGEERKTPSKKEVKKEAPPSPAGGLPTPPKSELLEAIKRETERQLKLAELRIQSKHLEGELIDYAAAKRKAIAEVHKELKEDLQQAVAATPPPKEQRRSYDSGTPSIALRPPAAPGDSGTPSIELKPPSAPARKNWNWNA
jgi:hypothetical protein